MLLVARGMSDPNDLPPWLLRLIRTSSTIRRLGLDPDDIAQEVLVALLESLCLDQGLAMPIVATTATLPAPAIRSPVASPP